MPFANNNEQDGLTTGLIEAPNDLVKFITYERFYYTVSHLAARNKDKMLITYCFEEKR